MSKSCVCIKPKSVKELHELGVQALEAAQMLELRLDGFESIPFEAIEHFVAACRLPLILTLRTVEQGGDYDGSNYCSLVEKLVDMISACKTSAFVDIEYGHQKEWIEAFDVPVVLSHHNFESTPDDLVELFQNLKEVNASVYKLATYANSTLDAIRMLVASRQMGPDCIGVCMGELGQSTRILTAAADNPWTYGALSDSHQTADGQLSVSELTQLYRIETATKETPIYALIGDPIHFSIGHEWHNQQYRDRDVDAVYVKWRITPQELGEFFTLIQQLPVKGLSVTIPHKEKLFSYLTQVTEHAREIGAVNTVSLSENDRAGSNTDAAGALDAIEQSRVVAGHTIVIIGAGGSARAVAYEAKRRGGHVVIAARRDEQARQLAEDLSVDWCAISQLPSYRFLVNTTPVEMPLDRNQIIPESCVMDLKTRPKWTELLMVAKDLGCQLVFGEQMFVSQALGQLDAWNVS